MQHMAPTLARLREMSDDEVVKAYDQATTTAVVGASFFLDELRRRELDRATAAALEEARQARRLAAWNMVVAIVAVVVTIAAIVAQVIIG